jgi:uncharacterized cupin superfamily protein
MEGEARLEDVGSGLAPAGPGWFVVNVLDAAWLRNEAFGARCVFQSDPRVLRNRPDLEPQLFPDLGVTLAVLEPGRPSGLYHAESAQEDFLVLAGECVLLVEGEERPLRQWDLVHCPAGTAHVFVGVGVGAGVGEGRCVLLMVGARTEGKSIVYPRSEAALARGAGVEQETGSPNEAYAPLPPWRPGRPEREHALPWHGEGARTAAEPRSPA